MLLKLVVVRLVLQVLLELSVNLVQLVQLVADQVIRLELRVRHLH